MSLVHYGFTREEVYWMPIAEMQDYIQLINEQTERENAELNSGSSNTEKPKTFNDVFGPMGNPLRK